MALTSSQQASRLFKKSLGAGETLVSKEYFSEPKLGRDNVFLSQLWSQSDLIPTTAPVLSNGETSGVVKYIEKLTLSVVPGSTNLSYFHADLIDAIPFNFDPNPAGSSYSYKLYKNDGTTSIPFGNPGGDWLLDTSAGLLTWYGTLPSGVSDVLPPKITFYKYVGTKGFSAVTTNISTEIVDRISGDTSLSTALSIEISQRISSDSSLSTLISNDLSIETSQRISSDDSLSTLISNEIFDRMSGDTSLSTLISNDLSTETSQRISSDNSLSTLISNEVFDRMSGDTSLSTILSIDASQRISSDTSLSTALSTETSQRISADISIINYIDSIATGLDPKESVITATVLNENIDLATPPFTTIGGYTLINIGSRILIKNQVDQRQNGIYVWNGEDTELTRAEDADGTPSNEVTLGNYVFVERGTNQGSGFVLSGTDSGSTTSVIIPDVNKQIWTLFSSAGSYNADGQGIELSGNTFSIELEIGGGLSKSVNGLAIDSTLSTNISNTIVGLSTETSQRISSDNSLSTGLSTETSQRISADLSLSTSLSTETSQRISSDNSLSVEIGSVVSNTISTETSQRISSDNSLSTLISNEIIERLSGDTYLSSLISIEIIERLSGDTYLSTVLSTETSQRISSDNSLSTLISIEESIRINIAGSGLTYSILTDKINVNVDNETIKIINNELRTPKTWMEFDSTTTISSGAGATNIVLDYEPVGYVSAYINGIEYLVSPIQGDSMSGCPFYFTDSIPVVGSTLYFDTTEAGFSLQSGIDLIMVKYHYISLT